MSSIPLLLALLLASTSSSTSVSLFLPSSNASISTTSSSSPAPPPPRTFLEEVVDAISEKERWDPDAEVRVWPVDATAARVAAVQRYEFRARAGGAASGLAVARLADEAVEWRRAAEPVVEEVDGPEVVAGAGAVRFGSGVRDLHLVGPVEVRVGGGKGDRIELQLPSLNATYTDLKRVLIADGIRIKVVGAQEVSFNHPHDIGLLANGSLVTYRTDPNPMWPLSYSSCAPLLTVHVVGSIVIVAHRTHRSGGRLRTLFKSSDTIELLSDKCHENGSKRLISACLFCSVSPRLKVLENLLTRWFGKRNVEARSIHFIKAKVTLITLVKFRLELERDIGEEDRVSKRVSEWKTKPKVQHVVLEVVARVQEEGRLKAVLIKKVREPFSVLEATSWSSLTSNVSFTQFSSFVVPPEALTLDVKW